jgi:hypothetical protein
MASESATVRVNSPAYQAYQILHIAFTAAPVIAGIDKFFHFLVNWDQYLSPIVPRVLGINGHTFMLGVGVIEVIAGFIVAVAPRIGGWIVGLWLCGIIVNLLTIPAHLDIALRDLGLALGAFALARLSTDFTEV